MANMPNGFLLLLCKIALFICHFHVGHTTKNSSPSYSNNNNTVTCIESERRALLEFKGSLVDKGNLLASWTTAQDCCSWNGITCNPRTGHVQRLHLHTYKDYSYGGQFDICTNCLGGEINPSILNLEHLNYLDLSSNDFSGIQIPVFLGSLKNLRYLNLVDAEFGGEIPPHLGNLSNLEYLSLGNNYSLTAKSLQWITGLRSLKVLDLSGTNLTESVDWMYSISMLPSLSSVTLVDCWLVGTHLSPPPYPSVNLTSLVSLDLGINYLMRNSTILLPFLNLTTQLAVLRLYSNGLLGPIPITSDKLGTLTVLDLSFNSLDSSSIPDSLCNHTNLIYLDLSWNLFQGLLPLCLGNLTSLTMLNLEENQFRGKIPNELGHLKQLTSLSLASNHFNSSIPSNFGELSKLENLDLSNNQLYGLVPSTLGQLRKLQKLDISKNSLTGELSESHFANLNSLAFFSISSNYFLSFILSSEWVPPFQLQNIQMDSIPLRSQFPLWLQTQRAVNELSMKNTSISGVIPFWVKKCSSIQTLYLSNNDIHGSLVSIPPNVDSLDLSNNLFTLSDISYVTNMSLGALRLDNNLLAGNIPNDLCNLSNLSVLSLANNQLTGSIPLCFGNLRHLMVLDLGNNSLSGHIPSMLGKLVSLWLLHLSRNKLYGVLPSSLKKMKSLKTLDLGENQFTGIIPDWIGKELSDLQYIMLESNHFYGNISIHLCELSSLHIISLAENKLVGHIPPCFGNLSTMASDDMALSFDIVAYTEGLWNIMKGIELKYSSSLDYMKSISLSGNNLQGEIPTELMNLEGLQSLNLSNNKLSGRIPETIVNLKHLESLDLAINQLSGPIPQSLTNIDTLSYLNLSFNKLVGRIPSGNHFDTLGNQSIYQGNIGLCGKPLARSCPDDAPPSKGKGRALDKNIDEGFEMSWFCSGIASGFAIGFVGVFWILYFKKSWRHAYFSFVETSMTKLQCTFLNSKES